MGKRVEPDPVIGTRVIDSIPAAINTSPWFMAIAPAAMFMVCMEEPQNLLTVVPAMVSGSPAMNPINLATLSPCSPSGKAQPQIRSSRSSWLNCTLPSSPFITWAAISSGLVLASAPLRAGVNGDLT
jgi:hypothetical protein